MLRCRSRSPQTSSATSAGSTPRRTSRSPSQTCAARSYLVDFWTYTCINCIRTFPYLKAWYSKYEHEGFEIVGVHTPEFAFEKAAKNVEGAINQNGLKYPVAQDNNFETWNAFRNQYWPAHYLIDAKGMIRYIHFGEGDYETTEEAIRSLLAEKGDARPRRRQRRPAARRRPGRATPETYLGRRARRALRERADPDPAPSDFGAAPAELLADELRLRRPVEDRPARRRPPGRTPAWI